MAKIKIDRHIADTEVIDSITQNETMFPGTVLWMRVEKWTHEVQDRRTHTFASSVLLAAVITILCMEAGPVLDDSLRAVTHLAVLTDLISLLIHRTTGEKRESEDGNKSEPASD